MKRTHSLLLLPILISFCSCNGIYNVSQLTYKEYIELVNDSKDNKFIVVFSQDYCANCKELKPYVNSYVKNDNTYPVYEINVTIKNGDFKDKTLGSYKKENDHLKELDNRIYNFVNTTNAKTMIMLYGSYYVYMSTPLIIWYENGIETKITNNILSMIDDTTQDAFNTYFNDFGSSSWKDAFDLESE